ncbi:ORFL68W, partial [Human betaherpesvirus 5]
VARTLSAPEAVSSVCPPEPALTI